MLSNNNNSLRKKIGIWSFQEQMKQNPDGKHYFNAEIIKMIAYHSAMHLEVDEV